MKPSRRRPLRLLLCPAALWLTWSTVALSAEPKGPTIAVLPLVGSSPLGAAGHAALLRIQGSLAAMPGSNLIHPKQIARVLEHHEAQLHDLPRDQLATAVGKIVGADVVIHGSMTLSARETRIELFARDVAKGSSAADQASGNTLLESLDRIRVVLPGLLKKAASISTTVPDASKVSPVTSSEAALLAYARCSETLAKQPIGMDKPVVLDRSTLEAAIAECLEALRADRRMLEPQAALGLGYALLAERKKAEQHLAHAKGASFPIPDYWIAKFWVVSRYHDGEAGLKVLHEALALYPGFLLARGYLGDAYVALKRYDEALAVFEAYRQAVPKQPWVLGRIGYVEAKLGKHDAALASTKAALALSPNDGELLLELGSRQIDAGRFEEAAKSLNALIARGGARGEVHLRLGYAFLRLGQLGRAEKELQRALDTATRPSEWRTRGRARYDLAKLWMQSGMVEQALDQLELAVKEGYRDVARFEKDADLAPLSNNPRFRKIVRAKVDRSAPIHLSPFAIDSSTGELTNDPLLDKPKGKTETVILRF